MVTHGGPIFWLCSLPCGGRRDAAETLAAIAGPSGRERVEAAANVAGLMRQITEEQVVEAAPTPATV